ncbi:TPA: hypothetical protein HA278_05325 [Candidatus Woesearchaeota archaeon]|nr:hypothetical protein [archaeon]HIJ11451.1 hypothetical protein [Candidatus Woesearchaeota archaeon]
MVHVRSRRRKKREDVSEKAVITLLAMLIIVSAISLVLYVTVLENVQVTLRPEAELYLEITESPTALVVTDPVREEINETNIK